MNRTLFVSVYFVLALLFNTSNSFSQIGFSFGVKGGATFSSFDGEDAHEVERRVGWAGGLFTNFSFLEVLSIQPEFLVQQKGATSTKNQHKNEIKLSYFQVPVLVKLRIPLGETVYPHVFAGPAFAFKLDGSYTSTNTQTGTQQNISISNVHNSETSGVAGAGIDFEGENIFFTLDARYGFGLSYLGDGTFDLHMKNRDLTLLAGIGIRIGTAKDKN